MDGQGRVQCDRKTVLLLLLLFEREIKRRVRRDRGKVRAEMEGAD